VGSFERESAGPVGQGGFKVRVIAVAPVLRLHAIYPRHSRHTKSRHSCGTGCIKRSLPRALIRHDPFLPATRLDCQPPPFYLLFVQTSYGHLLQSLAVRARTSSTSNNSKFLSRIGFHLSLQYATTLERLSPARRGRHDDGPPPEMSYLPHTRRSASSGRRVRPRHDLRASLFLFEPKSVYLLTSH
jgi:hypothetical protein